MSINEQANVKVTLNNEQAKKELNELKSEMKRLIDLKKKAEKKGDTKAYTQINNELKKVNKQAKDYEKKLFNVEKVLKDINGASLNDLYKAQRSLNAQMRSLNRNTKEFTEKQKQLKKIKNEIRNIHSETRSTSGGMGKLKNLASGLLPAFGFAAIIGGAIKAGKQLFNMYKETARARREVERLTGLGGKEMTNFTAEVEATAKTFGQDFNQVLVATNSFAKTMGISVQEALDKVNDGFLTGADSSGEFMDILKEYGPQFRSAGLSADQSIALISQQIKSGIYSDKGIDSIKEATISLREMTPATRKAIDNIGISSDNLQQQLRNGSITTFQAIQQISNRLAELPPQSSEVGTAIADIFKGAGEDAGLEYITMLGQAELSLDKLKEGAGENSQAQEKLLEANTKLKKAWSELMGEGSSGFTAIKAFAIDLVANGLNKVITGVAGIRDWFISLYNESLPIRAGIQYMVGIWKTNFAGLGVILTGLWENLKLGGKLIKAIFTLDLQGIKNAFAEYGENMKKKATESAIKIGNAWADAYNTTINGKIKPKKQVIEVETVEIDSTGKTKTETVTGFGKGEVSSGQPIGESMDEIDPLAAKINIEKDYTATVLEENKLRQQARDNSQAALEQQTQEEIQLQQQKRAAYLQSLDTIINVFGQESKIGRAALMAKQAYAIAETIINIAKGTGQTAASVPFPANIPLIIGFVGQVASLIATIKSATGKVKEHAAGRYPVMGESGNWYNTQYSGKPSTGFYNGPQLGIFNEDPQNPEMVIDGITTRRMNMNFPAVRDAIFSIRAGLPPRQFKEGKYPSLNEKLDEAEAYSGFSYMIHTGKADQIQNEILREIIARLDGVIQKNTEATTKFMEWKPTVYNEDIKKGLERLNQIETDSKM